MPPRKNENMFCKHVITHQVLPLEVRHLVDDRPKPSLEAREALGRLAALVVEAGVGDECGHVDVSHSVQ